MTPETTGTGLTSGKLQTLARACLDLRQEAENRLFRDGVPADRFLATLFRSQKKYGSRDRASISGVIFAWFRWLGWLKKAFPEEELRKERAIAAALAADGTDLPVFHLWAPDAPEDLFSQPTPSARFQSFLGFDPDCSDLDLIPECLRPFLPERPDLPERYLALLQTRPSLWLRAQGVPGGEICRSLLDQGFDSQEWSAVPGAIRVTSNKNVNLSGWSLYRNGSVEVQDLSSQCIGLAAGAGSGESWLDLCAGGGGKSLQLAFQVGKTGRITASDIRLFKLEHLKERALRAHLHNIRCIEKKEALAEQYDGVLVDAPCSSSGRWRRNPEMRWTATPDWLKHLNRTQMGVLEEGASAVRTNGILTYATCSIFPCENREIIQAFLLRHPDFRLEPFSDPHTGKITDGMLQTFPADGNCDGSFAARMRRTGGQ